MGWCTCSCGHRPEKYSNRDLLTLGKHEKRQSSEGCGPSIEGEQKGSCYDWCKNKGFEWPDNGEYEWGGQGDDCGLCSFDYGCDCKGTFDCCNIGGSKCTVKRIGYNGNPAICCLLGGSGNLTGVKFDEDKVDWGKVNDSTYTCDTSIINPYQQDDTIDCSSHVIEACSSMDQATMEQWDPKKNGLCEAWVSGAGSLNWSQAAGALQKSLQNFSNTYGSIDQKDNIPLQQYLGNVLDKCAQYPGACDVQLNQLCSTLTRDDVLNAYDGLSNNQNNNNIVSACGCHLPADQYTEYGKFGIDEKYYDSCDPLCKLNPAIPKATCDPNGNCESWPCKQTICIIDDVTVDVMDSNVPGGVNFDITCSGCKGDGCLCVFSDISIFTESSNVGKIDFNTRCGGKCALADPNKPGAYKYINCNTGQPTGGGGGGGKVQKKKIIEWMREHKKNIIIGLVVVVLLLIIIIAYYLNR